MPTARPNASRSRNCARIGIAARGGEWEMGREGDCDSIRFYGVSPTLPFSSSPSLNSLPVAVDQVHDFRAAGKIGAEDALHGGSHADAAWLAHAADRHAGMGGLDHHGDAFYIQLFDQKIRDILGHALLHLRLMRNAFD